ncbi:A/G-specific adenine glycosylase MutY [Opitutales bacterium ASA1]|uniref:A/G-specific adenine glycosylase n=1 Tax=Congregicoccus parvus TaxID=3081749 RepID=UPI002B30254D|nr:A/G-specific adenine glycosylase MutY [Opitutales bacterium ASA1]
MSPGAQTLLDSAPVFRARLAAWFDAKQRPLPWRTERSLYRTVVSELMLQQTQIATALPYFERWVRALPDFASLAAASEEQVLKLWEGLGYYRRARFLHRLARELVAREKPPRTADEWRELPGIGPYTAAAISSITYDAPAACVDGNVVRILARLSGDATAFTDGSRAVRHFEALAAALLDPASPGRHNEAMMELGATVCTKHAPRCLECPVAELCSGRAEGIAESLPRIARPDSIKQSVDRAWIVHDGRLLLVRSGADAGRLGGILELPRVADLTPAVDWENNAELLATHRRAITRYQITERIFRIEPRPAALRSLGGAEWIPLDAVETVTLSGPHRRWVKALLLAGEDTSRTARPAPRQGRLFA